MNPKKGFVYILSNKTRSVLYIGVTSNLLFRVHQHRNGTGSDFTAKYKLKYLVYYEKYASIQRAIEREKQLKRWRRKWKFDLIRDFNPKLRDLWPDISINP